MEATYYNRLRDTHGNTNIKDIFVPALGVAVS